MKERNTNWDKLNVNSKIVILNANVSVIIVEYIKKQLYTA